MSGDSIEVCAAELALRETTLYRFADSADRAALLRVGRLLHLQALDQPAGGGPSAIHAEGTATEFVQGLAGRLANRVQITSDGLEVYVGAALDAFSGDVDYAQLPTNAHSKKLENPPWVSRFRRQRTNLTVDREIAPFTVEFENPRWNLKFQAEIAPFTVEFEIPG